MANYLDTLSPQAKANAAKLVERMKAKGITNPFTHAAVLAVVSKESGFIPKNENLNYTATQLQKVFSVDAVKAAELAGKPEAIGNYVYSPSRKPTLGNKEGEGYKFRGRGFNQITGRYLYDKYGKLAGIDLISNPDKLNDPAVAADVAIEYFKNGIKELSRLGKLSQYNSQDINGFKTAKDSLGAIYHVNAGIGSSKAKIDADVTGGKAKAESRIEDILTFVQGAVSSNTGKALLFFFAFSVIGTGIYLYNKNS